MYFISDFDDRLFQQLLNNLFNKIRFWSDGEEDTLGHFYQNNLPLQIPR